MVDVIHEEQPKKIVIIAGPTFGTVAGFLLVGAAMGAAGAMYLQSRRSTPSAATDALDQDLIGGAQHNTVSSRAQSLKERVRTLSARTGDAIHSAREALAPAIREAIAEAKNAASKTEHELEEELNEAKAQDIQKAMEAELEARRENAE